MGVNITKRTGLWTHIRVKNRWGSGPAGHDDSRRRTSKIVRLFRSESYFYPRKKWRIWEWLRPV